MRRTALILSTLIIAGAFMFGSAAAQNSASRYAADPFSSEDDTTAASTPLDNDDSTDGETDSATSYESYESWPTGGKDLVQKKAMYRAQQRELRVASRQWYGYSAARPPVFGNPYYMSAYSPTLWVPTNWYGDYNSLYYPRRSVFWGHRWMGAPNTYEVSFSR